MKNLKFLSILVMCVSCQTYKSILKDNVAITIHTHENKGIKSASAMAEIKQNSMLYNYKLRFDYLLVNKAQINQKSSNKERTKIFNLYPDTIKLRSFYLENLSKDKQLKKYFIETYTANEHTDSKRLNVFSQLELMNVASKFFYCDKVLPDTSIQSHICIGINGTKEAKWNKDYTLLEAFCYEAIFDDLNKDSSQVYTDFYNTYNESCTQYISNIKSLDEYLLNVRTSVFNKMENSVVLKQMLMKYYAQNKNNLAFRISNELQ